MKLEVGMKVTTKESEEAYYSRYAGNPKCTFDPGDIGIITGFIWGIYSDRKYALVDFEKLGKTQRVALRLNQVKVLPNEEFLQNKINSLKEKRDKNYNEIQLQIDALETELDRIKNPGDGSWMFDE